VTQSPFYLYSKTQLKKNYLRYKEAVKNVECAFICYSLSANNNLHILKLLASMGSGAVVVSANEIEIALSAGFDP
jgi:diaminopimelate decarboxylase